MNELERTLIVLHSCDVLMLETDSEDLTVRGYQFKYQITEDNLLNKTEEVDNLEDVEESRDETED